MYKRKTLKKLNMKSASLPFHEALPLHRTSTPVFNISESPLPGRYLKFTPPYEKGGVRTTLLYTQTMLI